MSLRRRGPALPLVFGVLLAAMVTTTADGTDPDRPIGRAATGSAPARRIDMPRVISVIAGGDVLTESRVRSAAATGSLEGPRFDFGRLFAEVAPQISAADLAICQMEIPVGVPGGPYGYAGRSPFGGNLLLAPYEIAPGLRDTGFDRCSTASNHSYDLGVGGIDSTIAALYGVGVETSGTARTPAESVARVVDVDGVRVAHLAYTRTSNTVPPRDRWRLNLAPSPADVAADVEAARRSGAEIAIVSLHVSQELLEQPTAADRSFVAAITSAVSIDAVFMHGPHVVQPFEWVNGTPVWWSLGNFVSEMGPPSVGRYASPRTADGLLARVRFVDDRRGGFWAEPASVAICVDLVDRVVRPASEALRRHDLPFRVRAELGACLARTRVIVPNVE